MSRPPLHESYIPSRDTQEIHIRGLADDRYERDYSRSRRDLETQTGDLPSSPMRSPPRRSRYVSRSRSRSPRREDTYNQRQSYKDRSPAARRSPGRSRISRSSSPYRRDDPTSYGTPNQEVMLDNLEGLTKQDITRELENHYHVEKILEVRIIRDRKTGASRGFGFVRFASIDDAKSFIEKNYPTIYMYYDDGNRQNQATKVRIAYSRERSDSERPLLEGDWRCPQCSVTNYSRRTVCIRCGTLKGGADGLEFTRGKPAEASNNGDSDVSPDSTPSQFLLLRSLEASVNEDLLAKGATKLYKSDESEDEPLEAPAKPTSAKVISTAVTLHAGASPGSIRRVLLVRDRRTDESWRYGFVEYGSVEDAQAAFAKFNGLHKFTIASKPVLVSFIHGGVFVPALNMANSSGKDYTFPAASNPSLKLAYWDQEAYASELIVSASQGPVLSHLEDPKIASSKLAKDVESKPKKRKAEISNGSSAKKAVAQHLQAWTDKYNELHEMESNQAIEDSPAKQTDDQSQPQRSLGDPNRNCCYLCSRQFKSTAELNKHERLSTLHQTNLKNEELVTKALAKLEKAGITAGPEIDDGIETEYRDRAKERRQAYNQPKQPGFPGHGQGRKKKPADASSSSDPLQPQSLEAEPSPAASKGASLLSKMGWTSGAGLGASESGRTAPLESSLYASGVGLGAEGGKLGDAAEEAAKSTKFDYKEFVGRAKDKARERFEKMG